MPKDAVDKIIMFAVIALVGWTLVGLPIAGTYKIAPTTSVDVCVYRLIGICFVSPNSEGRLFGFGEFVQASALLILIYTVSDVRYRFRIATAPIPIWSTSIWIFATIGFGTIVTDLWFAREYSLPWFLASHAYWQLAFGAIFLTIVLVWLWTAFVKPPIFGKYNARNFTRAVYTYLLQGAEQDLPVIAAELRRSAEAIVAHVNELPFRGSNESRQQRGTRQPTASDYANDVLLLIANRKFCRHIVASSPGTAIEFFRAMSKLRKYRIPIGQFASNLSSEALLNRDSILYHEDEGYYSGFFGYVRPFTTALYGDFHLVEALTEGKSPLDIDLDVRWGLDAKQLKAYSRAVLTTFDDALHEGYFHNHSYALYRAFDTLQHATDDLYKLDIAPEDRETEEKRDVHARLGVVVDFIDRAINILEKYGVEETRYRRHDEPYHWRDDYYDHLAHMMFEIIANASAVKTKEFVNWTVQYGAVWSRFIGFDSGATRRIVLFKLRRLLFAEVLQLERSPNFRSAAILGFLLNVMGIKDTPKRGHRTAEYPLRRAVVSWTRRNYLQLVKRQHKVAAAAVLGTISFDSANSRLIKTYIEGLSLVAPTDILDLDQPTLN